MLSLFYMLFACLNAGVADRAFRRGRVTFGLVAACSCAFCLWMVWRGLAGVNP